MRRSRTGLVSRSRAAGRPTSPGIELSFNPAADAPNGLSLLKEVVPHITHGLRLPCPIRTIQPP